MSKKTFLKSLIKSNITNKGIASTVVILALISPAIAADSPWFGLPLPPPVDVSTPVLISGRSQQSSQFKTPEKSSEELLGGNIFADVATIVGFSHQSRSNKEVGEGQLWGRISGFPSARATAKWAQRQFIEAGISDVRIQTFPQEPDTSLWLPLNWSMTLEGNDSFGASSHDIILQSAMPLAPSQLPAEGLTAPLISVGTGRFAEIAGLNVQGKIVLQNVKPQGHMVFERQPTLERSRELFRRGALAVINVVELPGNLRARDFNNCGGPCFNLGGRDGHFLQQVLDKATASGSLDKVRLRLDLNTKQFSQLQAQNVVAVIPGDPDLTSQNEDAPSNSTSTKNIIINAHMDAWFDGAGDNADGLAVLVALARHFSHSKLAFDGNLIFVASAGHHSTGLNGPRNLVAQNPELMKNVQLIINIEHVAQRNIAPARQLHSDGYRQFTADANEAPIVAGVSINTPWIEALINDGIQRFGVNFVSAPSTMASGEGGGYRQLNKVIFTTMQAPPLYHTSGESVDMISEPGLEKMANFFAYFISQAAAINKTNK